MMENGAENPLFDGLDEFGYFYLFCNAKERNSASVLGNDVNEPSYFNFIKKKYVEVSQLSPVTDVYSVLSVVALQKFVDKIFIASISPFERLADMKRCEHVMFDIFDVKEVEQFVEENKITTIFLPDIRMVHDIVFNFKTNVDSMTFIVSKLMNNFSELEDRIVSQCQHVFDAKQEYNYNVAYINLHDITRDFIKSEI